MNKISSHNLFVNASTKKLTPVNNTIPIYDIAFEHLLIHDSLSNIVNCTQACTFSLLIEKAEKPSYTYV